MRQTVTRWLGRLTAAVGQPATLGQGTLVRIYLLAVGGYSLAFYLVPPGHYDRHANLLTSALAFLALPLVRHERLQPLLAHGVTVLTTVLLLYMASCTGGINSHVLVWLCLLPIAVMLLRGVRPALGWVVVNVLLLAGLYLASDRGLINPDSLVSESASSWALMNQMLVLTGLLLAVLIYDNQYRSQKQGMDLQNQELRRVHQTLIETQAHKDEFLAAVSHELRTPMNAILGLNGVLCKAFADQPEDLEMAGHIRQSTERLLHVVNGILDFCQLEAGRLGLHRTDFDLHTLLREAIEACGERAREKGLICVLQMADGLPRHVHADRQRLRQVIDNLLDNAIRFTTQGQVSLRARHTADRLRFEVQDTGCGIASERQAGIFSGFESLDLQTPWAHQGTGLGLGLCERLVRLQSGAIGVSSEVGRGSLFWVELPLVVAQPPAARSPSEENLKMLLVDDNPVNLMVASLQLRRLWPHAEIVQADSGHQALQLLQARDFDVALIDMLMPEMDGLQLTARIRAQSDHRKAHLPVVALTANHEPQELQRCLAAGMDAVARKPIEPDALINSVRQALRKDMA